MKVALWAEIRRLAEIEKLSGRMIARRLHCSRHTVAAALALQQPPASQAARRSSLLAPYLDQIKELLAKYSTARDAAPVSIPSCWRCAAISACSRSPARGGTRNRKGWWKGACATSSTTAWRDGPRN